MSTPSPSHAPADHRPRMEEPGHGAAPPGPKYHVADCPAVPGVDERRDRLITGWTGE